MGARTIIAVVGGGQDYHCNSGGQDYHCNSAGARTIIAVVGGPGLSLHVS